MGKRSLPAGEPVGEAVTSTQRCARTEVGGEADIEKRDICGLPGENARGDGVGYDSCLDKPSRIVFTHDSRQSWRGSSLAEGPLE